MLRFHPFAVAVRHEWGCATSPPSALPSALGTGRVLLISLLGISLLVGESSVSAEDRPVPKPSELTLNPQQAAGQKIYARQCQECHGDQGQGVEGGFEKRLIGDRTVGELTRLIAKTMPEGDVEACVGEDAEAVATYIHYAFYSEAAQIRNRPPRVELTRLTANQLRQSLAELYASQAGIVSYSDRRGLQGEYFAGSNHRRQNRKAERIDAVIDFDFGDAGPGEGIDAKEFSIRWSGGLVPDRTGNHQIIIRSSCAFIAYLGSSRREFINNRVQSGDKTEFRRAIELTSGRVYPLRLDFIQRKRKTQQPPAWIQLSWVPPHGEEEIIGKRYWIPDATRPAFALQTNLPPDDRSYGFERGSAVDAQWDQSTTDAALEFAEMAIDELWPAYLARHKNDPNENREVIKSFLAEIVSVAFRGPLDEQTRAMYIDKQVDAEPDDADAIRRSLLVSLKSPRFLYPLLDSERTRSQRVANRLALTLWDSLPADGWLQTQIREDRLQEESQIRAAATRMVNDFRTRGKTRQLIHEWLGIREDVKVTKDPERFPDYSPELFAELRRSFDAFVEDIVWSEGGRWPDLFTAQWIYTSDRLAAFYGESWSVPPTADNAIEAETSESAQSSQPSGALHRSTTPDPTRAGLLTHPYMMTRLAYHDSTSPIHRGVFLIRHVLGRTMRPPQEAFTPLSPDLHPDLTTRQRVELQTSPENCQACHTKINGLGFALENFDAVGRYRTKERNRPVDASGRYTNRAEKTIQFTGARSLAEFVAESEDAKRAFVSRAFLHFAKQPPAAYGADTLDELMKKFEQADMNVPALIVEIAVVVATRFPDEPTQDQVTTVTDESLHLTAYPRTQLIHELNTNHE